MKDRSLIGTLAAWKAGTDWVVFTPDGLFDASPEGERSVTWRHEPARDAGAPRGEAIARLEQFRDQRFVFDLAETLSRGEDPKPPARLPEAPPPQVVVEPVSDPGPKARQVDFKIRLSDEGIVDLRLYQNGVAVLGDLKPEGRTAKATLTLVSGSNRIYARRVERDRSTAARRRSCSIMMGPRGAGCTCSPWVSASIRRKPCSTRRRMHRPSRHS